MQVRAIGVLESDPERFQRRYLEQFGRILNADNASELFADYAKDAETRARLVRAVRAPAAALIDRLFIDLLREVPAPGKHGVVFTAGGNAAGKSTSVVGDSDAHIVFDSTFSAREPSIANIQKALDGGHPVAVRYLWRDPEVAFRAALVRAMLTGRTVALRGLLQTHVGARNTVLHVADHHAANPRVVMYVYENTSEGLQPRNLNWLKWHADCQADVLAGRLRDVLEEEHASGRISDTVYAGTRSLNANERNVHAAE